MTVLFTTVYIINFLGLDTSDTSVPQVNVLLDAQAVSLLVGLLIPVLVGIVTKMTASPGLKAVVNSLLAIVGGTLAAFTQDGFFQSDLRTVLMSVGTAWVMSVATYYGVYKPTGVAGTIQAKTANFGIGSPPSMQTDEKGME